MSQDMSPVTNYLPVHGIHSEDQWPLGKASGGSDPRLLYLSSIEVEFNSFLKQQQKPVTIQIGGPHLYIWNRVS